MGVRFGKTLVIEDVDVVEPALVPLLRHDHSNQGPRCVVQLGEKQVDLNDNFKMFLCSKNEQIKLPEYVQSAVSVVNFSTTKSGLASQLLSLAIEIEKPELEEKCKKLVSEAEVLKIQLDQLEQQLLNELANSEGSLLENTQLLSSLNSSKENAEKIGKSLAESEKLQKELDKERNVYESFVQKCSQLYFGINQLHHRNHVYNFNVNTVIKLFKKTFTESMKDVNSESRLDSLYRSLQWLVYDTVSRAMFKADRLMFAMEFIHVAQPSAFLKNEWEMFLGQLISSDSMDDSQIRRGSAINWISESRRLDVAKLQTHLPTLYHALNIEDQQTWSTFSSSTECESAFPTSVDSRLNPFQKLLVVQALRPDRLYSAMNKFGCQMLAVKSLNNSLDLHKLFKEESSAKEPILMFIGAGADPSQELSEFASKCIGPGKFHQIAMGKGLERSVLDNLRQIAGKGEWLCLSNVHLVVDGVMRILQELAQCTIDENGNFRLWLVAEPDDHFPTVFLQECIKLTYEAPPGIKNNLQRTYSQWVQNAAEMNNAGDMDLRLKSVFVMSWLHAVLQERRNFIPQGWLKFYEFSNADIKAGKHVLDYLFQVASKSANSEFDWESLRGLLQDTIYGGRIENALDMGALNAYLSDFFNSSMISKSKEVSIPQVLRVPSLNSLQEYAGWISSNFPAENLPLFLGLPRNISFFWEITQSSETIFQLRQLRQLGSLKELTFSRDLWSQGLTPLLNLWKKLNQNSNLHSSTISETGVANDPFEEILQLEYVYAKKLIHIVHSSLTIISKTIKGTINADAKTIELAKALLSQEIPASWDSSWTGTKNLREYMEQLIHKAKAIQNLLGVASKGSLLEDKSLSLAQLFRPVALLNALRQVTARKKQTSMEKLRLATAWQASQLASETHIVLSNLQLQGALFDGKELRPVGQTSPALSTTAPLYIAWVAEEGSKSGGKDSGVDIPLFTNSDRNLMPISQERIVGSATNSPVVVRNNRGKRKSSVYSSYFTNGKFNECDFVSQGALPSCNAKRHLLSHHPELPIFRNSPRQLLAWYASTTSMPVSHVENKYLKSLLSLVPGFIPPTRRALSNDISKEFSTLMAKVYKTICDSPASVSISADIATTRGIAAHFWNPASKTFETVALDLVLIEDRHTGPNIARLIQKSLDEANVKKVPLRFVTDGASNMKAAIQDPFLSANQDPIMEEPLLIINAEVVEEKIDIDLIEFGVDFEDSFTDIELPRHTICAAHTLQLVLKDVFESSPTMTSLRKRVFTTIGKFSKSYVATQKLIKRTKKTLLFPANTRWSTLQIVYSRLLLVFDEESNSRMVDELNLICHSEKWQTILEADITTLEEVLEILDVFRELTDKLQQDTKPTISLLLPGILCLSKFLKDHVGQKAICCSLNERLLKRFKHVLDSSDPIYLASTFLDPSVVCMDVVVPYRNAAKSAIKSMAINLSISLEDEIEQSPKSIVSGTKQSTPIFSFYGSDLRPTNHLDLQRSNIDDEIEVYLNHVWEPTTSNNPAEYWDRYQKRFPKLAPIAFSVLPSPAHSGSVERIFSQLTLHTGVHKNATNGPLAKRKVLMSFNQKYIVTEENVID